MFCLNTYFLLQRAISILFVCACVYVCVRVCVYVRVYVCVCVCVQEGEQLEWGSNCSPVPFVLPILTL